MKMFKALKSVLVPSVEQKEAAKFAANTCKTTAFIMAKRIFRILRKVVFKLLERFHLGRFATPVTAYLLLCLGVVLLRCIPGIDALAMMALNILAHVIGAGILLVVALKLFKFVRRCYVEAKEELANQSQEPSEVTDDSDKG